MSAHPPLAVAPLDRVSAAAWYLRNRARSRAIFDLIEPSAYYSRPIALRNPIVFYEGHLPAFSVIAFLRRGLGCPPVDERLEALFARGIDPDSVDAAVPRSGASTLWPSRDAVLAFAARCDEAILDALEHSPELPLDGLYTALEHEAMHQETLLYMWHRLPYDQKRTGSALGVLGSASGSAGSRFAVRDPVRVPAGDAVLGADRAVVPFGWDNEFEAHRVHVPAFEIDAFPVTNGDYLEFVEAGGYSQRDLWSDEGWRWLDSEYVQYPSFWILDDAGWRWRGMFETVPLPLDTPVYVSQAEASAYARWKGRRLMTEPEFHRAAYGSRDGVAATAQAPEGFYDFAGFDPVPVGAFPPSPFGAFDLVGNGWEWTSTVFAPFGGFVPMASYPEYSADFFDRQHYVLKGASPATARELVRPSFRNWFRANYPYVYAKFRTVR
ncbi:MAG TPA: SUMF1/EgtB/PvdO family nonheme iron enzyme [Vicinamibacterales bacterium]|nr:SUMF1/EgtB/PvdO family nonheme iron enzyme [Vicinamibacterales bacterium]